MHALRRILTWIFTPESGLDLIADERQRQLSIEDFNGAHDNEHMDGSLGAAAACYAHPHLVYVQQHGATRGAPYVNAWPWEPTWDKRVRNREFRHPTPQTKLARQLRIRELAKAGALCAAEIDRLQRVEVALRRDTPIEWRRA